MHVHNALHRFTEQQAGYRAALGEEDPAFQGLERAGETLTPVINLWERPEWALLRGEHLWSVSPSVSATVGEFGQCGIRNPAASGVICVVTRVSVFPTVPAAFRVLEIRIGAEAATDATAQPMSRDTRRINLTGGTGPLVSLAHSDATRLGALIAAWPCDSDGSTFAWEEPFVISPGFQLLAGLATSNSAVQATLSGYWRRALPGELAF